MPNLIVTGVGADIDGTYLLDLGEMFTYGESRIIKQVSGARALEVGSALDAGDTDVILAMAVIALNRAGKDISADAFLKVKIDAVRLEPTPEEEAATQEDAAIPPASGPPSRPETNSDTSSSGDSMSNGSATSQDAALPSTGDQTSATGATSDRETLNI